MAEQALPGIEASRAKPVSPLGGSGSPCAPIPAPCRARLHPLRRLLRRLRRSHRAPQPDRAVPRPVPAAAGLAGWRQLAVPFRHRRSRPRSPLAADLWRPAFPHHRQHRRHPVAGTRHRLRPAVGVLPRDSRYRDHAAHGHPALRPQPATGHRGGRDPGAGPAQCHDRHRHHLCAELCGLTRASVLTELSRTMSPPRGSPAPARSA